MASRTPCKRLTPRRYRGHVLPQKMVELERCQSWRPRGSPSPAKCSRTKRAQN
ncbi:unnamed protein product [Periconia digitata]|uniref:Uncharacterized protein n=1 Tax=Periconia digitata TaxID=1303443 RepID=A0A9W4XE66_9PLEO|nr:unnamed protein product [Periconia digitata]